jgi:DNA-binding MarR family transcriptional regulator
MSEPHTNTSIVRSNSLRCANLWTMRTSRRSRSGEEPSSGIDAETETFQECLRKLVQLLPQITRGLRRRAVPPGVQEGKLGPRHGVALSLLRAHRPLTISQLAARLRLTLPTVSGIIAEVEQVGFVERSTDPKDRRRTIVTLLPQHDAAVATWLDDATAPLARALDKLSPDERVTFLRGMTLLEAELDEANELPSPRPKRACS